jgi:zinc protease
MLANLLVNNLFAGRDMEYYAKLESRIADLTVEEVNEAIEEFISPDNLVIATAGDFSKPTQPDANAKAKDKVKEKETVPPKENKDKKP